ncbi:hypothetical protein BGP77_08375 [Saccharospirillum sp. MSK14-1]|uniref:RNA polymerase sigma factor n=1 Tax=Saccharospirillum sp. MSK14-1 TaxID=1897632 RepID=UPI000D332291|nr:sigma-70 family RNA polymerase sigma factor [Saccharospirillum sp. MSK14-1]PTY35655.1 hypothetical protein BGP77_08375 [Saccharospirillum sp. MSK14-1]
MRPSQYSQLCALARRHLPNSSDVEDVVQEAYLAAFEAGRVDFEAVETRQWLVGTVRNKARMATRSTVRRQQRETLWSNDACDVAPTDQNAVAVWLKRLSPALKSVALLALSGHSRREIQYLLGLTDTSLRQRIVSLKQQARQEAMSTPADLPGLLPGLAYGRIRQALLSKLFYRGGALASHDPDGYLFVIRGSQNPVWRQ